MSKAKPFVWNAAIFAYYVKYSGLTTQEILAALRHKGFQYGRGSVFEWKRAESTGPAHLAAVRAIITILARDTRDVKEMQRLLTGTARPGR